MPFTTKIDADKIAIATGKVAPSTGQWEMWIADALMLINDRAAELNVTAIDQVKIDYVVRESVAAHVRRPGDETQVIVAVDDGSTSKTYRSGKGRVTIAEDDWKRLGLTEPSGAFAVDMMPAGYAHLPWCTLMMGGTYCSCGVDIACIPIYEDPEGDC